MKKLHYVNCKLTKNKYLELQWQAWSYRDAGQYFDFHTHWTIMGDHAGFETHMEILGCFINLVIYDSRHWDYENNQWKK